MVALVATSVFWWQPLLFVIKLVVPGPSYDRADDRSSSPAEVVDGPALPTIEAVEGRRGALADEPPTISLELVAEFDGATAFADPPGPGPVLVTEQAGRLVELDLASGETAALLDVGEQISSGGERGLLGVAVDPGGERVYLHFTAGDGDVEVRSWPADDLGGEGVLHLTIGQPFQNHNGGNLVFGPDGALWIGTGDGGGAGDRGNAAQSDDTVLGKMLRVLPDPEGGVVAPASNDTGAGWERPEIWAIGLRNPWRYSFDRATGELWVADVGQNSVEEVTRVAPDAEQVNFGWRLLEGRNDYEGEPSPDLTDPVITYTHDDGCSVTGGHVYRGSAVPDLDGWYVFGDFCGGWIRGVPVGEPGSEVPEPVELIEDAGNVRAFGEDDDGELYVLTTRGVERVVGSGS